jgi:hypothetical protein
MKQAEYQESQERIAPHRDVSADTTLHSRAILLSQVPSVDTTAVTVLPKRAQVFLPLRAT